MRDRFGNNSPSLEELREMYENLVLDHPCMNLHDIDLDLVGFDCWNELAPDERDGCPFGPPGCGKKPGPDCPLMRQRAAIVIPTQTKQ
jgi:hypothetical protein